MTRLLILRAQTPPWLGVADARVAGLNGPTIHRLRWGLLNADNNVA